MPLVTNTLIDTLPRTARNRLLSICESVDLVSGHVVSGSNTLTRHVYFPTGSILSLMTSSSDSPMLEVGMVGSEGMLGLQVVLAVGNVPLQASVRHGHEAGAGMQIAEAIGAGDREPGLRDDGLEAGRQGARGRIG